jgi:hypothetical protein
MKRVLKNKNSQSEITVSQLVYSTSTESFYRIKSFARYFWIKNPKNAKYLVFVSHAKTSDENIITLYDALKNKTSIIVVAKNTESVDLEGVIKKLPKNAIIKKTLSGLVIPYLETKAGKIIIRY